RRSDQEDALRDLAAESPIALGLLQEVHDLLELRLRLFDAGNIGEPHFDVLLAVDAGAVLAERERGADSALREPARGEAPDEHEDADWQDPREEQIAPEGVLDPPGEDDTLLRELLEERVVVDVRKPGDLEEELGLGARPFRGERLVALERLAQLL